jgi:hypothetical protein
MNLPFGNTLSGAGVMISGAIAARCGCAAEAGGFDADWPVEDDAKGWASVATVAFGAGRFSSRADALVFADDAGCMDCVGAKAPVAVVPRASGAAAAAPTLAEFVAAAAATGGRGFVADCSVTACLSRA